MAPPFVPYAVGGAYGAGAGAAGGGAAEAVGPRAGMGIRYGSDGKPLDGLEAAILRGLSGAPRPPQRTESMLTGDSQSPPPPPEGGGVSAGLGGGGDYKGTAAEPAHLVI